MTGRAEDTQVLRARAPCGGAGGSRQGKGGQKTRWTVLARLLMRGVPLAWRQVCFPLASCVFYAGEVAKGLLWCHGKYQGRSLVSGSGICDVKLSVTIGTRWGILHAGSCSRLVRVQGEATFSVFEQSGTRYFCAELAGWMETSGQAWLPPCSGAAWGQPGSAGLWGGEVVRSEEGTWPLCFCFRRQPSSLPVWCVSYVLTWRGRAGSHRAPRGSCEQFQGLSDACGSLSSISLLLRRHELLSLGP